MKKKDNVKIEVGEYRPFPNEKPYKSIYQQVSEAREEGRKQGMVQGIALAINYMYRGEDERGIWKSAGLSVEECIANKVDEYDMDMILQHREELEK